MVLGASIPTLTATSNGIALSTVRETDSREAATGAVAMIDGLVLDAMVRGRAEIDVEEALRTLWPDGPVLGSPVSEATTWPQPRQAP